MDAIPGQVRLYPGDVVQLDGGPCIVTFTNESRAVVARLDRSRGPENISPNVARYLRLECRGEAGLQQFLAGRGARPAGETNTPQEERTDMRRKRAKDSPARGKDGVAEQTSQEAKPRSRRKPAPTSDPDTSCKSRGKLGNIMGYSIGSVLRALGARGVSHADAMAMMQKAGVAPAAATVKLQMAAGAKGRGGLAPLSEEQFAALAK